MHPIGADGDGTGLGHHDALGDHEHDRRADGEPHHDQADQRVLDRVRRHQPADGFDHQEGGRAGDEGALPQAGQRLRLAVTEAVFPVGRRERVADGEEIDGRGRDVERGIGERRHHRDGIGDDVGDGLQQHQNRGHADRGGRHPHHHPAVGAAEGGRVGHGNSRSVRHGPHEPALPSRR